MLKPISVLSLVLIFFLINGCDKKGSDQSTEQNTDKSTFVWKDKLTVNDIPEFDVKGYINGKEVQILYVNFEKWRGNGDNVINFGTKLPEQNCGAVNNDSAFHIMRPSRDFAQGEFLKESFTKDVDGYVADFHVFEGQESRKISVPWNCALVLDEISERTVKGRIAMCFKDDKNSWVAGKFEAIRCNN